MVIASDIIEHLENPDDLMSYIRKLRPRYIVISTPDRNLMRYPESHHGPPMNTAHIREWSFAELRAYVDQFFAVKEHLFPTRRRRRSGCSVCHLASEAFFACGRAAG
jgi:hypothetical protein